jgi:hypothetical protein
MKKLTRQQLLDYYFSGLDIEFDNSLTNLQRYSVSTSINMEQLNDFNKIHQLDPEQIYTKTLYNEMLSGIFKNLMKIFTQMGKVVDLRDKGMFSTKELGNFMRSLNESNFIANSNVSSLLMDLPNYSSFTGRTNSHLNTTIYKIGFIDNKNISVDPIMRFNDTRILSYDKIKINLIIDEPLQVVDPHTCNTRTVISYRMDFSVVNPKINYVIVDETSQDIKEKVNGELIRVNRDKVLNILLND